MNQSINEHRRRVSLNKLMSGQLFGQRSVAAAAPVIYCYPPLYILRATTTFDTAVGRIDTVALPIIIRELHDVSDGLLLRFFFASTSARLLRRTTQ